MADLAPSVVVFDLGGVLIDWDPRYLYRKLIADPDEMERFLDEICTPAWNLEQDRGRSLDEATALLTNAYPEHAELIEAYYGRWTEMIGGVFSDSVEVLEDLTREGVPVHALSNWSAETFARVEPAYPFLGWFEHRVISGEIGLIKPDAEIYAHLEALTGLPPAAHCFVDDKEENVAAALARGWHGVVFRDPQWLRFDLRAQGLPV